MIKSKHGTHSPAGGCYNFTGHSQPDVQYKANAVKTSAKGYRSIWFRNGNTTIDIAYPAYYMRGAIMPTGLPIYASLADPPAAGCATRCRVYVSVSVFLSYSTSIILVLPSVRHGGVTLCGNSAKFSLWQGRILRPEEWPIVCQRWQNKGAAVAPVRSSKPPGLCAAAVLAC